MRRLERSRCAVLPLVLKGKWYDMIERGFKKEEYRDATPYWEKRIKNWMGRRFIAHVVEFRHGYAKDARRIAFMACAIIRPRKYLEPHRGWGEPEGPRFVIEIGEQVWLTDD